MKSKTLTSYPEKTAESIVAGSQSAVNNVTPSSAKVKTLPPSVVKDIEQKNIARKLAGLSPIVIKVRRCIACGAYFESAGNRTCGCTSRVVGSMAGRDIIY